MTIPEDSGRPATLREPEACVPLKYRAVAEEALSSGCVRSAAVSFSGPRPPILVSRGRQDSRDIREHQQPMVP